MFIKVKEQLYLNLFVALAVLVALNIGVSTTAANLSGHSAASFINGNLRRYIASNLSTYAFPVGSVSGADWITGGGLLDILGGIGRLVSSGFAMRSGLTSFSEFGIGDGSSGGSSLPIQLISFEATLNDRAEVELNWAIAIEINNDYFTVERSADGTTFEPVLEVTGAGNSNVMRTYNDLDKEPLSGLSYYRLKQTDYDGTSTYSQMRSVSLVRNSVAPSMVVYPNPSAGNIQVESKGVQGMVSIIITDMQGKTIYLQHEMINEGDTPISLELKNKLYPGFYQLTMMGANVNLVEKIIIQ
jgi:hypothetical protein